MAMAAAAFPSTAMARLDFRLVPDLTAQIVVGLLREHLDVRGFKDIEIMRNLPRSWAEAAKKANEPTAATR